MSHSRPRAASALLSLRECAVLGAGLGIGRIGATACEATARQPEVKGQIFTNMLLTAALIEGVAFAAVILVG